MTQELVAAFVLACSLALGPLISTSHHSTSKTYGSVRATLNWTGELRWQNPDDGGPRYKATLVGPASVQIDASGMPPQELLLTPFMLPNTPYTPVEAGGCGATTNLAILPKAGSPLPYVVAFVVLAQKGCMAIPMVFVPLRTGETYRYVAAPYFAMWWSRPKVMSRIRVASVHRLSLPGGLQPGVHAWNVFLVTNAFSTGPRVAVFEPPWKPKQITPGSTILLGDYYGAWFAH